MSERPFMQFYPSDFVGDTMHLTAEQVGSYLLLLMAMWNANGTLPNDEKKLARIARLHLNKWRIVADDLMEFFVIQGDILTHTRMKKEIKKLDIRTQVRRESGKRGGEAKSLKDKEAALASAMRLPQHLPEPYGKGEEPLPPEPDKGKKPTLDSVVKKKGKRLADDWVLPPDWKQWAFDQGLDPPTIQDQADRFKDYWIGKPGQGGVKLDWLATWRNWIRNNKQSNGKGTNGNGTGQPKSSQASRGDALTAAFERRYGTRPNNEGNQGPPVDNGFSGTTIDGTANGRGH